MAWLGAWKYRRKVTIDNTNIDSNLTHFPVPIVLGTSVGQSSQDVSGIFDEVGSFSKKIAITKTDGTTQIYGEIETWDDTAEKAVIWVSKSDLVLSSSVTTDLYIYYDLAQSDNTTYMGDVTDTPAQSVWDSDFVAVYHMAQDPSGGAGAIKDSTSNANHGTSSGAMASGDLIAGQIGKALDFDGSNDLVFNTALGTLNTQDAYTLEGLVKLSSGGASQRIFSLGDYSSDSQQIFIRTDTSNYAQVFARGADTDTASIVADNVDLNDASYHYVAGTIDGSLGFTELYREGVSKGTKTEGAFTANTIDSAYISAWYSITSVQFLHGANSETRLSNIVRSAAWIKATSHAVNDNLLTFSAPDVAINTPSTVIGTLASMAPGVLLSCPVAQVATSVAISGLFSGSFVITQPVRVATTAAANPSIAIGTQPVQVATTTAANPSIAIGTQPVQVVIGVTSGIFSGVFIAPDPAVVALSAGANPGAIVAGGVAVVSAASSANPSMLLMAVPVTIGTVVGAKAPSVFTTGDAILRYYLVITGSPDIEIPITSFQARRRSGDPTYLSVVIPDIDIIDEITARASGLMQIYQGYERNGVELQREKIIETTIDTPNTYQGGTNQSIVLIGYTTSTFSPQTLELSGSTYRAVINGKITHRLARPYIFLNPGDTVTIGGDTFTVGLMSYAISPTTQLTQITEA